MKDPHKLASYYIDDVPSEGAIVRNNYGEGSVVLSTVHPEISNDLLNTLRKGEALKPGRNIFWPYHTEYAFKEKFSPIKESARFNEFLLKMIFTESGIIPRESEVMLEEKKCPA